MKASKFYKRKQWTDDEIQRLTDWAGIYDCATIGKKMKRSKDSVQAKLKRMGMTMIEAKKSIGVYPTDFAKKMGMNRNNVWNWIVRWNLPLIKYPKSMNINKDQANILIDDTKLKSWLMNGYVYSTQVNPIDWQYQRAVRDARQVLDFKYIQRDDIIKACNITPKILQSWKYLRGFPRPELIINGAGISLHSRPAVIDWALKNPKYITGLQAMHLRMAGIGHNMKNDF